MQCNNHPHTALKNNVYSITILPLASFNTSAQEFIKTTDDSAAHHFIRRVDNTDWLYNESGADRPQGSIYVADWPDGTCTVHVDTPLGLAVKKLEKVE